MNKSCELCNKLFIQDDIISKTKCCNKLCHTKCIKLCNDHLYGCLICKKRNNNTSNHDDHDTYASIVAKKEIMKSIENKWCGGINIGSNYIGMVVPDMSFEDIFAGKLAIETERMELSKICTYINYKIFYCSAR